MEKEIKELIQQRDLAQSRLEDLLRALGDDHGSGYWDTFDKPFVSHVPDAREEELSADDSSITLDFSFNKSSDLQDFANGGANSSASCVGHVENINEYDSLSIHHSISSLHSSTVASMHGGAVIPKVNCPVIEDLCKEVHCIETDEAENSNNVSREGSDSPVSSPLHETNHGGQGGQESVTRPIDDINSDRRKTVEHFIKEFAKVPSSWSSTGATSRALGLTKSRSCRASLMDCSISPWFLEEDRLVATPPDITLKDFPGRPDRFHRRIFPLNCHHANMASLECDHQTLERTFGNENEPGNAEVGMDEVITDVSTFDSELKEMAGDHSWKQLTDQMLVQVCGDVENRKPINDSGMDTDKRLTRSPSLWLEEFEKQKHEIIELWHTCNVSLVHRTYFFLLFKGDRKDSVYVEVELRRLSYLKQVFMQGNTSKVAKNEHRFTLSSSIGALQRERRMLCRQMQRRLSAEQRKNLYHKWGIPLNSKKRKKQLAGLLWSQTRNMDHIIESASVVANLVGPLEQEQVLKEMFGLSFTPQRMSPGFHSWKRGITFLI